MKKKGPIAHSVRALTLPIAIGTVGEEKKGPIAHSVRATDSPDSYRDSR
ncbi:MAG: hypothetical protein IPH28_11650 [Cytophagaceae bacterium]|nr:hypothetical protein [Cytophagaceae bacterium]